MTPGGSANPLTISEQVWDMTEANEAEQSKRLEPDGAAILS